MWHKILAYTSNELVAKETHYHRTWYRNYTRPQKGHQQGECDSHEEDQSAESNPVKSSESETHVHSHVFSHIKNSLFSTDSASRCNHLSMSELPDILTRNLTEHPPEYLVSAKRNLKRRITAEFGDSVSLQSVYDIRRCMCSSIKNNYIYHDVDSKNLCTLFPLFVFYCLVQVRFTCGPQGNFIGLIW